MIVMALKDQEAVTTNRIIKFVVALAKVIGPINHLLAWDLNTHPIVLLELKLKERSTTKAKVMQVSPE